MTEASLLENKTVLVVDDETDILDVVEEVLDMCLIHKASTYEEALQYILSYTYNIVILDIMGVRGFDLLRECVNRGFPTVMLTAHALSAKALKKSIQLGAVSYLPKEKIPELPAFIEDVVMNRGRPVWAKLFIMLKDTFDHRFGKGWEKKDRFFREFVETIRQDRSQNK